MPTRKHNLSDRTVDVITALAAGYVLNLALVWPPTLIGLLFAVLTIVLYGEVTAILSEIRDEEPPRAFAA